MSIQQTDVLYTAVATAENGRDGRVATDDGRLDVVVNPPKEMGGNGAGTNPEQLFAAGYSACFQGALGVVARQEKADITGSTVTAKVGIGRNELHVRGPRRVPQHIDFVVIRRIGSEERTLFCKRYMLVQVHRRGSPARRSDRAAASSSPR